MPDRWRINCSTVIPFLSARSVTPGPDQPGTKLTTRDFNPKSISRSLICWQAAIAVRVFEIEAQRIRDMQKEREIMELKRKHQQTRMEEQRKLEQEAAARRRNLEQQEDKAIASLDSSGNVWKKMCNAFTSKINWENVCITTRGLQAIPVLFALAAPFLDEIENCLHFIISKSPPL